MRPAAGVTHAVGRLEAAFMGSPARIGYVWRNGGRNRARFHVVRQCDRSPGIRFQDVGPSALWTTVAERRPLRGPNPRQALRGNWHSCEAPDEAL